RQMLDAAIGTPQRLNIYHAILDETLVACRPASPHVETNVPRKPYWPLQILESLAKNLVSRNISTLTTGELLLALAFPAFISSARREWINTQFAVEPNEDWYLDLVSAMPSGGQLSGLSESGKQLVSWCAIHRTTRRRQASWREQEIRASGADARLARWMAADA